MDELRLWHKFLENIKSNISSTNFKTFFSKSLLKSIEGDKITIVTSSAFIKETLYQRHLELIESTFEKLLEKKVSVVIEVQTFDEEVKTEPEEEFFQPIHAQTSSLNPKFTMENFVVGPSNNVAFAAGQAIIQNPGTSYNPLFLYGGTGVGKTHLMLGIGNAILKKSPGSSVIYCSSEKFMNDYVTAIQNHKMGDLRAKYRSAHLLLIDDIQFFSGREGTQEEFFHTFNELQSKNSQIIMTSDRSPNEIIKLEDRLRSRFAGGLMVDIQHPDFDTRVAILRAKGAEWGSILSEDSLKLIASHTESSIRELEGKLLQIIQILKTQNLEPSVENIAMFLNKTPKKSLSLTHTQVMSGICSYFSVTNKDLIGPKRQKGLVLPRHITMYILSEELGMTVEKIGQILGGRDHTTVMHARDKMKELITRDSEIQKIFTSVKQSLNAS